MILCPVCGTLPNVPGENGWPDRPARWAMCSCRMTCFKTHTWQWRFGHDSSFQNSSDFALNGGFSILVRISNGELLRNAAGSRPRFVRPEDVSEIIRELTVASVLES